LLSIEGCNLLLQSSRKRDDIINKLSINTLRMFWGITIKGFSLLICSIIGKASGLDHSWPDHIDH